MKTSLFYLLLAMSSVLTAQNKGVNTPPSPVTFHPIHIEPTECIPEEVRIEVNRTVEENKLAILKENPNAFNTRTAHPLFILPFRAKADFDDYGYYSIFNQVDQNLVPNGNLLDYNCGQRTYDWVTGNHGGTDYVVWPYPWKKMEDDVMEVIAAAPGIIMDKRDGNFDHNCDNNGNPLWNGIVVEHADGSRAWYWHFKSGAITSKIIGDSVAEGEYLGGAGSSGSSTIPHLHFEVFDSAGHRIDPYAGPCNSMNSDTWWQNQPNYFVPEMLTISTHNSQAFDDECPLVENTYEHYNFDTGDDIVFRSFYRDLQNGAPIHFTFKKPDASILYDWVLESPWPDSVVAWAQYVFPVDSSWPTGVYTITAVFAGNTYESQFGIRTPLGVEDLQNSEISVYPNPTNDQVNVEARSLIEKVEVYDLLGRMVVEEFPMSNKTQLNLGHLKSGMYMAIISSEGKKTVKKLLKE
ncbi:MAG TPA: T9SS type A sorting domain-containing protein [Aequorivita sp.]|nr:T9SS type A sorting domain-containing protein [Aequorivita sp.]